MPLKVAGAAAGPGKIATLTVNASYDGGTTWKSAPVTSDTSGARTASVKHPTTVKAVSYRMNAYRLTP